MLAVGLRVIRGPNWRWEDQDNGAGHVGTVIEVGRAGEEGSPEKTVVVLWDHGNKSNYRAGYEDAYDLRIVDSAPAGIRHQGLACNECEKNIFGIRWLCKECNDFDLCTPCYMDGKHDLNHVFLRFETENSHGVEMGPRRGCPTIQLKGIFVGAKVCRGANWNWDKQDGGEGNSGRVVEIQNWQSESSRSVANVTWALGSTNVYRVGHKGQVDLKALEPSLGGLYFIEHLPLMGKLQTDDRPQRNFNSPKHQPFNVGDKVKVFKTADELQKMQAGHGGWNPRMGDFIEKLGVVHRVTDRGDIRVQYSTSNQRWTFHPAVLTKVRAFMVGELVRVSDDLEKVKENQKNHGDWVEAMTGVLGKVGVVQEIYSDGDLRVAVKGQPVWTLNSFNVEPVPVTPEKRSKNSIEMKNLSAIFGELEVASAMGSLDLIKNFVEKHPNNVDMKTTGKTLLQIAAHEGKNEVAGVLLDAGASLEEVDDEGDTALHYAAFGRQCSMLEFLISRGAPVDIPSKKQQTTALHVAVIKNCPECVAMLLARKANVNSQDCFGDTPLHDSIGKGYNDIFNLLVAIPGLNLKLRNKRGFNALQHAALKGNDYAVKKLLEISPQMVDISKDDGFTPLHLASLNGHFSTVVALLQDGKSNVNSHNNRKQTALHLTVNQGEAGVMEKLIFHGASPNLQDDNGDTALHIALSKACGNPEYPVNHNHCENLELFEEVNAAEFGDNYKSPALAVICLLICFGSDLNIVNSRKETAMNLVNLLTKFFPKIMDVVKLHSAKPSWLEQQKDESSKKLGESQEILTPPPSTSKPVPPMNLLECSVCSEQDKNVKFEPCGDVVVCEECAGRMKKCLFCHMPISRLITKVGQIISLNERQSSSDRLKVLESKIAEIEEANCCSICMERPRNVVFLCGHSSCDICAQPLKVCHMCRKPITNKINIF